MDRKENKIKGCLIGGALGDALGTPVEFDRWDKIKLMHGADGVTELADNNIISDDTQMTLFTCEGIINSDGDIIASVYQSYLNWLLTQGYHRTRYSFSLQKRIELFPETESELLDIPELHKRRSPGNTCISALLQDKMGTIEHPLNDSKGSGGIMRAAPIGFIENADSFKLGCESAAITHGHPGGYVPAGILADIIHTLVYSTHSLRSAMQMAIDKTRKAYPTAYRTLALAERAIELTTSRRYNNFESIIELGEGWTGDEALAIALYSALKYQDNVKDALLCAVNHNGDSDTTGSITGHIIGAHLGYVNIPKDWEEKLELREVILDVAARVLQA